MSAIRMGAVNAPMIPRSQSVFQVRGAGRDALGAGIIRLALPLEAILDLHVYFSQTYDAPPSLKVTELVQVTKSKQRLMTKVFFHIGLHKTGTTWLQNQFFSRLDGVKVLHT